MNNWTLLPDMPEQHESIFAKCYGTEKWKPVMFRKCSDKMLVTVEHKDGTRLVCTGTLLDEAWKIDSIALRECRVIAWMPFPEPCA